MDEEQPPSRPNGQQEHRITMLLLSNSINGVQLQVEGTPGRSEAQVTRLNSDNAREPNDEDDGRPGAAYNLSELLRVPSFNDDVLLQEKVPQNLVHKASTSCTEASTSCTEDRLLCDESLFQGIDRTLFSFCSLTDSHNSCDEAKLHWFIVIMWNEASFAEVFTTLGIEQCIGGDKHPCIYNEGHFYWVSDDLQGINIKISSPYPLIKRQALSSTRKFFSMVNQICKTNFQVIPMWIQDVIPAIDEDCVICKDTLQKGNCVQLGCTAKYKFHPQCIVKWTLEEYERCPLCNMDIMLYFPFTRSVLKEKLILIHP